MLPLQESTRRDAGVEVISAKDRAPRTFLRGKTARVLLQDRDGSMWVGTTTGLYRIRRGQVEEYPLGGHTPRPDVTVLLQDRDRNLWIGTLDDGLIRANKQGIQHYSTAQGLSGGEVRSLFEDDAGNLWVGVFGGGLELFRDTMFTPYGVPEGVSANVVWSVMQGRDSSIWMGTQAAGLNRLKDGKLTVYSTRRGFTDNTVGAMYEGRDGTIWLGKDSGLSRFRDGKMLGAPQAGPFHQQVHAIYEDPEGTVWIGTRTSGVARLRDGKYTYLTTREGLINDNVQAIVPDKRGGLWIGTLGGLSYYNHGRFTNFTSKNGLAADQIISLYEDAGGTLWIGTDGLARLKDGKITSYTDQNGLFDQNPLAIVEDDAGYLWLSTNKGLFRVSKRELNDYAEGRVKQVSPQAFGAEDGMRAAECNGGSSPSGWKDREGDLWFATVAGALKVDPHHLGFRSQPLQLHVEEIVADARDFAPSPGLRLPAGSHELEFHYVAPYFSGRVRYRYRLEGFENDWVDAGNRLAAYYTNLAPGRYRFRVVANTADGGSPAETSVTFYVAPRFYQTKLFYAVVIAAALGMVFLIWLWAHRYLIHRQNQLQELVAARTRELETEKAELLEAKAALILQASHDSLTGLMNRAAILRVVEKELRQAEREKRSFAVMLLDLDHFKAINDTYGHLMGDQVLREFARRLINNLRPYDHAGRFGGEEFLIVMAGISDDYLNRVRKLHHALCDMPFVCDGAQLSFTCSIGMASYTPEITDSEPLLHLADQALYAAKANGRNRIEVAGRQDRTAVEL